MISIKDVTKKFYDKSGTITILDNVSIDFPDTGFVAVCGKSGCGKTTLLKMIAGKINDYDGKILYNGLDVTSLSKIKQSEFYANNIFYLKYNENFFNKLTIKKAISFYLNQSQEELMYSYINKFSLNQLLHKKIGNISSGELQKISLCFALAKRAKITILDEPICNIDAKSINIFLDEIKKLSNEVLVIYVSHFERDITSYYDKKIRIYNGNINEEIINSSNTLCKETNASNKFNLYNAFTCEKIKPQSVYAVFRLIILIFLSINIMIQSFSKIDYSDVYIRTLNKMSVNLFDSSISLNENLEDYHCIKKHKLYFDNGNNNYLFLPFSLISETNGTEATIFLDNLGIADDYSFYGFDGTMEENDIIISDLIADYMNLSVGSTINGPRYFINAKSVKDTYTIKWIYKTDYYSEGGKPTYSNINNYDYKYRIVFISQKKLDSFTNLCKTSSIGIPLDSSLYLSMWRTEFDSVRNLPTLNEKEFYASYKYLMDYLDFDINDIFNRVGEYFEVKFSYKGKTIVETLKYMGHIDDNNYKIAVSDTLYNELYNEFYSENIELFDNYTTINSINTKADDFKDFAVKYLRNKEAIEFANKSIVSENFAKKFTTKSIIENNIIYLYFFGIIFILISILNIIKIEKYSYVMLKEKNYNIINALITNTIIKLFIWLFLSIILVLINLYSKEILINILLN